MILCGIICCNQAQAQVTYAYDASGNRTNRVITFTSKSPAQPQSSEEEEPTAQKVYSEDLKDFSIRIYPNPTKGDITVEIHQLPEGKTVTLTLYSMAGSLIMQKAGVRDIEHFNISKQPNGVYLLKITAKDSTSSTEWKIIKK